MFLHDHFLDFPDFSLTFLTNIQFPDFSLTSMASVTCSHHTIEIFPLYLGDEMSEIFFTKLATSQTFQSFNPLCNIKEMNSKPI